jgi:elongation factor Ts
MTFSIDVLKQLREETLAPFGACKKALTESGGDLSLAMDWLRKNGALVGAKKTDRLASEGAIAADCVGGFGALIEISSETDFVARGDQFKGMVSSILGVAMARSEMAADRLLDHPFDSENHKRGTIGECILELAGTIGENIVLRRLAALNVDPGVVVSYIHQSFPGTPNIGTLGVLVALESEANEDELKDLGKNLAMQIAFTKPHCVSIDKVAPLVLEKEKKFLQDQIQEQSGDRPAEVQVKMVEGRLRKFFETIVLEEQDYVRDSEKTVKEFVKQEAERLGKPIRIAGFAYAKLGESSKEGHEKAQEE